MEGPQMTELEKRLWNEYMAAMDRVKKAAENYGKACDELEKARNAYRSHLANRDINRVGVE